MGYKKVDFSVSLAPSNLKSAGEHLAMETSCTSSRRFNSCLPLSRAPLCQSSKIPYKSLADLRPKLLENRMSLLHDLKGTPNVIRGQLKDSESQLKGMSR